ncbi:MAG: hypothetical protein CMH83_21595 [Nocardioides sp.]|nr:hypothetical protein [Nocardioides sp.]
MTALHRTVRTAAPAALVWALVSDLRSTEEWDLTTVRTTLLHGDGGLGSRYEHVVRIGGVRVPLTCVVAESVPGRHVRYDGISQDLNTRISLDVTPDEHGSTLDWSATYHRRGTAVPPWSTTEAALEQLADATAESLAESLDHLLVDARG